MTDEHLQREANFVLAPNRTIAESIVARAFGASEPAGQETDDSVDLIVTFRKSRGRESHRGGDIVEIEGRKLGHNRLCVLNARRKLVQLDLGVPFYRLLHPPSMPQDMLLQLLVFAKFECHDIDMVGKRRFFVEHGGKPEGLGHASLPRRTISARIAS
jgi:hypothetical protein